MLDSLLSLIAPHPCYTCGKLGNVLCDNCKYDIMSETGNACIVCQRPTLHDNLCQREKWAFSRAWYTGERSDTLRQIIDAYKFENVFAASATLAELLHHRLGELPSSVVIVPLPTLSAHIRQRGYDHTWRLAKELGRMQYRPVKRLLRRTTKSVQRGASKSNRFRQAEVAFEATKNLPGGTYLLVDDVLTTGASAHYAAKALREAGADDVWLGVVARQPLD